MFSKRQVKVLLSFAKWFKGVNNVYIDTFLFPETGDWCGLGGISTVVPMELSGFVAGRNTITFGNENDAQGERIPSPTIEWISVVM